MYQVVYSQKAYKELSKLDRHEAALILSWIEKNLVNCVNPRQFGKALTSNLKDIWRYRVGDYRILCKIEDSKITILILTLGHRRDIDK